MNYTFYENALFVMDDRTNARVTAALKAKPLTAEVVNPRATRVSRILAERARRNCVLARNLVGPPFFSFFFWSSLIS